MCQEQLILQLFFLLSIIFILWFQLLQVMLHPLDELGNVICLHVHQLVCSLHAAIAVCIHLAPWPLLPGFTLGVCTLHNPVDAFTLSVLEE